MDWGPGMVGAQKGGSVSHAGQMAAHLQRLPPKTLGGDRFHRWAVSATEVRVQRCETLRVPEKRGRGGHAPASPDLGKEGPFQLPRLPFPIHGETGQGEYCPPWERFSEYLRALTMVCEAPGLMQLGSWGPFREGGHPGARGGVCPDRKVRPGIRIEGQAGPPRQAHHAFQKAQAVVETAWPGHSPETGRTWTHRCCWFLCLFPGCSWAVGRWSGEPGSERHGFSILPGPEAVPLLRCCVTSDG